MSRSRASQRIAPPLNPLGQVRFALDEPFQENWRGVGADYMGFADFAELGESAAEQEAEFDRAQTSGIKIARTWFDFGWALPTYPTGTPDYDLTEFENICTWVAAMQDRGIKVVLTMGWHFPGNVCGLTRETIPTCTPTPADEAVWTGMVSGSLHELINVRGFDNIIACFFFTEPNNTDGSNVPVGYTEFEYYAHLVTEARAQIAADDAGRTPILPRVMLMSAEEFTQTADYEYLEYMRDNADAQVDGYTAHRYYQEPDFDPLGLSSSGALAYAPAVAAFEDAVALAAPKEVWSDECGFLIGGDSDSTGYRATADAGWQLVRQIMSHMAAGCAASLPWMLQDQRWFTDYDTFLKYGVAGDPTVSNAVRPAWAAFGLVANLMGGGGGTELYHADDGLGPDVHALAAFVPFGVRGAVDPDGEWSFLVFNESLATPISLRFGVSLGGRTVYRYDYSGEMPPPAGIDGTYVKPWTRKFEDVTDTVPLTTIPGRGFSIFSTMNISAPARENLALTATATATEAGAAGPPSTVNDGNWTNVEGAQNGWKKSSDDPESLELTWPTAQTIDTVTLALVGTTPGQVYADYATTAEPAPLADYTLEYWNGSTYVEIEDVTGNTDVNPTHTFAPVSTTKLKVTPNSAGATSQINQLAAYAP